MHNPLPLRPNPHKLSGVDTKILYMVTAIALLISVVANREKTWQGVKIGVKRLLRIAPTFLVMLVFISIVLYLLPEGTIARYLGDSRPLMGILTASVIGSLTLMPGFIAFPLAGILRAKGVPMMTIAAFTTTLMMVGVLTFPLEQRYFGTRVAIIRNIVSLFIALAVTIAVGLLFGEMGLFLS